MTTTPTRDPWQGANVRRARAYVAAQLMPGPCGQGPACLLGRDVLPHDEWVVGHKLPRWSHPELTLEPSNWQPEHRTCSDASSHDERRRQTEAARAAVNAGLVKHIGPVFSDDDDASSPGSARTHTLGDGEGSGAGEAPVSRPEDYVGVPWLADLLDVPEDAAWPRHMSPVHPEAVGSYGVEFEAYCRDELGVELRWWQRLASRMELQHRADGSLCVSTIVESGPRRIGKSVRLRASALWRVDRGAELFGEVQLVLHTGKDLPIAKEIHRKAWAWAKARDWIVRKGMGNEELEAPDGSRWAVRGKDSVYGYDVTRSMIDEAWGVAPTVFDEGLEPATLERSSPQNLLTSTAHRKATQLMKRLIAAAMVAIRNGEGSSLLLLLWCAAPDADPGDPAVWRAASPHWSPEREKLIRDKYERAMRGEADPSAEDPDPMAGFVAQYLNVWPQGGAVVLPGEAVVDGVEWAALARRVPVPEAPVVSVEASFGEGLTVAVAEWVPVEGRVGVRVVSVATIGEAAAVVGEYAERAAVLVGASIADDPRWGGCEPVTGTARAAALDLRRMLDEGCVVHDGSSGELAAQVLGLRVQPGNDGPRLVSRGRTDAVKAVTRAVGRVLEMGGEPPAIF